MVGTESFDTAEEIVSALSFLEKPIKEGKRIYARVDVETWFAEAEARKETSETYWQGRGGIKTVACGRLFSLTRHALCLLDIYRPGYGRFIWIPRSVIIGLTIEQEVGYIAETGNKIHCD